MLVPYDDDTSSDSSSDEEMTLQEPKVKIQVEKTAKDIAALAVSDTSPEKKILFVCTETFKNILGLWEDVQESQRDDLRPCMTVIDECHESSFLFHTNELKAAEEKKHKPKHRYCIPPGYIKAFYNAKKEKDAKEVVHGGSLHTAMCTRDVDLPQRQTQAPLSIQKINSERRALQLISDYIDGQVILWQQHQLDDPMELVSHELTVLKMREICASSQGQGDWPRGVHKAGNAIISELKKLWFANICEVRENILKYNGKVVQKTDWMDFATKEEALKWETKVKEERKPLSPYSDLWAEGKDLLAALHAKATATSSPPSAVSSWHDQEKRLSFKKPIPVVRPIQWKSFEKAQQEESVLFSLPGGGGKSLLAAYHAVAALEGRAKGKIIVTAPRQALVCNIMASFARACAQKDITLLCCNEHYLLLLPELQANGIAPVLVDTATEVKAAGTLQEQQARVIRIRCFEQMKKRLTLNKKGYDDKIPLDWRLCLMSATPGKLARGSDLKWLYPFTEITADDEFLLHTQNILPIDLHGTNPEEIEKMEDKKDAGTHDSVQSEQPVKRRKLTEQLYIIDRKDYGKISCDIWGLALTANQWCGHLKGTWSGKALNIKFCAERVQRGKPDAVTGKPKITFCFLQEVCAPAQDKKTEQGSLTYPMESITQYVIPFLTAVETLTFLSKAKFDLDAILSSSTLPEFRGYSKGLPEEKFKLYVATRRLALLRCISTSSPIEKHLVLAQEKALDLFYDVTGREVEFIDNITDRYEVSDDIATPRERWEVTQSFITINTSFRCSMRLSHKYRVRGRAIASPVRTPNVIRATFQAYKSRLADIAYTTNAFTYHISGTYLHDFHPDYLEMLAVGELRRIVGEYDTAAIEALLYPLENKFAVPRQIPHCPIDWEDDREDDRKLSQFLLYSLGFSDKTEKAWKACAKRAKALAPATRQRILNLFSEQLRRPSQLEELLERIDEPILKHLIIAGFPKQEEDEEEE